MMKLDVAKIREDFPIFNREIRRGQRLVYLDSGATSQKPRMVLDAERAFYENYNAAAHRGAHQLAEEATSAYESARESVANFIGAYSNEIVFTKSATESLNLLAYTIPLKSGEEVLVTEMEHHANLIPWQQAIKRSGALLKSISVTAEGRLDLTNLDVLINSKTKVIAITHQSNVLGTINDLSKIVTRAKQVGAVVVLDACQSAPHMKIDVKELDVDFIGGQGPLTKEEEQQIIRQNMMLGDKQINPVVKKEDIVAARKTVREVYMDEKIERYILDIVFSSRFPSENGLIVR